MKMLLFRIVPGLLLAALFFAWTVTLLVGQNLTAPEHIVATAPQHIVAVNGILFPVLTVAAVLAAYNLGLWLEPAKSDQVPA